MRPRVVSWPLEELPDPWAIAADVLAAEVEEREWRRELERCLGALVSLSWHALAVLRELDRGGGRALEGELLAALPAGADMCVGLDELVAAGLLDVAWALDADGDPVEGIVSLRYVVEMG